MWIHCCLWIARRYKYVGSCVCVCVLCLYGVLVIKVQDIARLCSLSTGIVFSLHVRTRGGTVERRSLSLVGNLSQSQPSARKPLLFERLFRKDQNSDTLTDTLVARLNCFVSFLTGQTCWTPRWNQTPASAFSFQWKNEADEPACCIVSKKEPHKTFWHPMRDNSKTTDSWPWC